MSTPAPAASAVPSLLTFLESEALVAFGPALVTFVQAGQKNPTPMGEVAAWVQLQGNIVGALPGAEASVIQQVNTLILTKLQAALAKAQANVAAGQPV